MVDRWKIATDEIAHNAAYCSDYTADSSELEVAPLRPRAAPTGSPFAITRRLLLLLPLPSSSSFLCVPPYFSILYSLFECNTHSHEYLRAGIYIHIDVYIYIFIYIYISHEY